MLSLLLLLMGPLCLALALWLAWPLWSRWREQGQVDRRIATLGDQHLRGVLLEDGMGGHSYYDWLLLTPDGFCLLVSKAHQGNIFAGERLEHWTQVIGSRSYHFSNPLFELEPLRATLRYHFPKMPLQAAVVFTGSCRFPKGHPDGVLTREQLPEAARLHAIPLSQQQAWEQLKAKVRRPDPLLEQHLLDASPWQSSRAISALLLAVSGGLMMLGGWLW